MCKFAKPIIPEPDQIVFEYGNWLMGKTVSHIIDGLLADPPITAIFCKVLNVFLARWHAINAIMPPPVCDVYLTMDKCHMLHWVLYSTIFSHFV